MKSPSFRDLIVLLFLAICDARLWCLTVTYDKETSGCCNGVVYTTTTSGCCGTKIYDKSRDHIDYECCADIHVYKRYEQTCCGSVVRNNTDIDQEDVCCENKFHPKTEGVCCDNIFHKHGDKNRHSCCGKLLNDNNNKMCCNGKLHNGTKYPGQKCCGTETYNKFTHWCDERDPDIILLLGQKTCYGQKYLTKTKICCHGQLRKIISKMSINDDACCGTTSYNSKESSVKCDNNQLVPKGNTPEPTRCGNKAIKETIQGCCNGAQFDLLNQICCGGTILHKSKKCCDGRELDTAKYVCCKGDKIEQQVKLQPNSDECCLLKNGSFQTFNRKYSECSLALGVAPKGSRCGTLLYNKSTDLCCQGILFKNGTLQKRKCCGVKSYDTQCQECQHDGIKDLKTCNEHVKFKETQHYCGKKEYNKDRDLCCRDKLYVNGTTQRKGCCGIKSYLKKNKKCLHGEIREGRVCPNYCQRSWIQNNQTSLTWKKNKTKMCKYKVYSISYLTGKTWEINYRKKSKNVVFEKDCRCLFKGKKEAILVSKRITKAGKIRGQFYLLPISKNNKQKTKRLIKKVKNDIRIKNKKNISCTSKSKKKIMKEKTKSE